MVFLIVAVVFVTRYRRDEQGAESDLSMGDELITDVKACGGRRVHQGHRATP